MNAARVCPTPLLDATPSTIDGFLSGRYQFAIAPSRPQFRTTRCCHSSPRPIVGQGNEVYLTPQNFIEFWAVATRPVEGNGFGWTSERAAKEVADLQERFPKLREWLSSYCMGGRIVEISREGDGEISNYSANTKK